MMNFNETIVLIGEDVSIWTCYKFCKFYALFSYFLKKYTGTLLLTSARDKQFIINRFLYIR